MAIELHRATDGDNELKLVRMGDVVGLEFDLVSPGAIEYFEVNHRADAINRCLQTEAEFIREACR